ncbi:hypothetical protein ACSNOI_09465 [Actinomadura kijaniata]
MSEWRVSGFEEIRELGRGTQGRVVHRALRPDNVTVPAGGFHGAVNGR